MTLFQICRLSTMERSALRVAGDVTANAVSNAYVL